MDSPILWFVFGGVFAALLVVPRVLAWIAGITLVVKSPGTRVRRAVLSLGPLFLHSGPWLLILTIGALYYVASLSRPAWFWAFIGGLGLGVALMVGAIAVAYLRGRQGIAVPLPLTPERLAKIRRRFFWTNSLFVGGGLAALMIYQTGLAFALFIVPVCLGGGLLFAWFMWQWYGAELRARDEARQRAAK